MDGVLSLLSGQIPDGPRFTPRMVRGLSYYSGPIWELVAPGVAGSIAGGGRYDHLIEQLGGPDVPATGATIGVERILPLLAADPAAASGRLDVAVTVMRTDLAAQSFGFAATAGLLACGPACTWDRLANSAGSSNGRGGRALVLDLRRTRA